MKKLFVILVLMMLFVSGCSFNNLETSNLMRPPKATGEMAEIQSLIEKTVGSDIIFKYPQNGEHRSAIILHDIDNDNQNEAVAVYQLTPQDTQTYIMIIDKVDGNWSVVKTLTSQNTNLDKICFGDINGNGQDDIILGWSSYTNYGKELTVILSDYGDYNALYLDETYSDMIVNDFDSDGRSEILTLSLSKRENVNDSTTDRSARARLLKFDIQKSNFSLMGTTFIDSTVVQYNSVKFGNIDEVHKGAVIDAKTVKEKTTTEIVYWDSINKRLTAPLYNSQTFSSNAFLRDSVIQSNDINNDGIIEVPKIDLTSDVSNPIDAYVLSWFKYDTKNHSQDYVESIIMNDNDSYIFVVPSKWKTQTQGIYKIKLSYDYDSKSMSVFETVSANGQSVTGREILNITVYSKSEYQGLDDKDRYIVLSEENNKVYVASVLAENTDLTLLPNEVINNFKVI